MRDPLENESHGLVAVWEWHLGLKVSLGLCPCLFLAWLGEDQSHHLNATGKRGMPAQNNSLELKGNMGIVQDRETKSPGLRWGTSRERSLMCFQGNRIQGEIVTAQMRAKLLDRSVPEGKVSTDTEKESKRQAAWKTSSKRQGGC